MSYQQNLPGYGPVDPPSDAYWYNSDRGTVPDTQLPDMQGIAGTEQYYRSLALQQTADARYMPPLQPGFARIGATWDASLNKACAAVIAMTS